MANLRKIARDKECQVRLPEICNGDSNTTVLAHFRLSGISGMSMKSPDICGAWACSACHAVIDSPATHGIDRDFARLAHLEGVIRTQAILIERGVVKW